MNERPMTLKELGEHFGFSRERARQLEIRAKDKLKIELAALMAEMQTDRRLRADAATAGNEVGSGKRVLTVVG